MKVKVEEYGYWKNKGFVIFEITNLKEKELNFLKNSLKKLKEKFKIKEDVLYIKVFHEKEFFPFKSEEAKIKPTNFISREEIEMTYFLLGLLEDMD
jgi:hypothetical protein